MLLSWVKPRHRLRRAQFLLGMKLKRQSAVVPPLWLVPWYAARRECSVVWFQWLHFCMVLGILWILQRHLVRTKIRILGESRLELLDSHGAMGFDGSHIVGSLQFWIEALMFAPDVNQKVPTVLPRF